MMDHSGFKNHQNEHLIYAGRAGFAVLILVIVVGVLVWRYHDLQVNRYQDFVTLSDQNRIHARAVPPPRGLIFDRNGVLLADNYPGFILSVVVERAVDREALINELRALLDISDDDIERFNKLLARRRPYESVPLRINLTEEERSVLAVNEYRLQGVEISAQLVRNYPKKDYLAHVLGYVGRINEQELKKLDPIAYSGTHLIGKTGLEKYYEADLHGEVGYEYVETNARGRVMRILDRVEPKRGKDVYLHLDHRLQDLAYQLLEGERGAVVAIEVATGGVLAMASAPSYDPNPFVTGISTKAYQALINSAERPLFDRALRGQYPPGSTVKPVYGIAALDSGIASASYAVRDPGFFQLENEPRKYRDWKRGGHGKAINLYDAIVQSCDVYFYTVGVNMGIDRLSKYGKAFGFGADTGIDLPAEASGIMPSRDWKRGSRGIIWYPGDTVNTSIGQGFMNATPLQLAVVASRLASRGEVRAPKLVQKIGGDLIPNPLTDVMNIDSRHWDHVLGAMAGVVTDQRGTARRALAAIKYPMAGKTGTAQVVGIKQDERYDASKMAKLQLDHALFIAFAPLDNPRIAVGVIVENGEHGSSTAAPVAGQIVDAYMKFYPHQVTPLEADVVAVDSAGSDFE
ncbi:MAG: penicillin-binding protein 2 [Porticoccaceae bacterium]|nr:penicillin-binding protein 2 [Porticoccaceae bacterium]